MKNIHFAIPLSVVWAGATAATFWTGNCEPFCYALIAMILVGVGYVML